MRNSISNLSNYILLQICVIAAMYLFSQLLGVLKGFTDKRKKTKIKRSHTKEYLYKTETISTMLLENDIIEILIRKDDCTFLIGAGSDYDKADDRFFDKTYFINGDEYVSEDAMIRALNKMFPDGIIPVREIDNLSPEQYKYEYL